MSEPSVVHSVLLTLVGLLLVVLNGFFVAAEFAIVKLRNTQASELVAHHGIRGRVLFKVRSHLDAYLSACQLGITLASLGLGWIGEPAFAHLLEPLLASVGVTDKEVVAGVSFAVAFALISFLHIVLGELAPKSLALRRAEAVSLSTALPLFLFHWLMYPFIYVLNASANIILRIAGIQPAQEGDTVHSREELRHVVKASHRHGEFEPVEARVLTRGLELGELIVGDITQPLSELVSLSLDHDIERILERVRATRYTRYPLRDPDSGAFVGLLHIKDLITLPGRLRDIANIRAHLRELPRVAEDTSLAILLDRFRQGTPHFAMVTDAFGTIIGFVTFEHVVEVFVGPVDDEFVKEARKWHLNDDRSVSGPASLSLLSLEDVLGKSMPSVDANSVGGLVVETLGRIPTPGERIEFDGFAVEIIAVDGPRIEQVRVYPKTEGAEIDEPNG